MLRYYAVSLLPVDYTLCDKIGCIQFILSWYIYSLCTPNNLHNHLRTRPPNFLIIQRKLDFRSHYKIYSLFPSEETPGLVNIGLVKTCSGGSAVLPCFPHGEALVVEGVSLKRQRGREPVEVLYHSKRHHSGSTPSSSSSHFPVERVQLSSAPGPNGITYNLTLRQLQADDSALYSCQLLVHGGSDSSTSLGRQVFFVSVQGGQCGCSNYSTLLYALSSAVVILLLLLLLGFVVIYKGKARRSVKSHPQAPIYEEMTGVQPVCRKLAPNHLEEMEFSEYRNCPVKKSCPENHYESPRGALNPQT
ncbi:uncharacterized protein LOC121963480 [Plectropomus leopardus]|uniref:uncharacterized protein LOC121963480 n=1 Tax=Plectropomus leopardus TaxID=160734 RepID=UPI001C4C8B9D|nr:uncharacterized protein LOC121963480 [Plectropomus leopardus]